MDTALFRFNTHWQREFPRAALIQDGPTDVQTLSAFRVKGWNPGNPIPKSFSIKREDKTDVFFYGGNKVRNCEFLIGDALKKRKKKLVTVAPMGSNFVAALAAQSRRAGLVLEINHFIPVTTQQIEAHKTFSQKMGAKMAFFPGRRGALAAWGNTMARHLDRDYYVVPPGGSDGIGALGHVNAVLELAEQVARKEVSQPSVVIVGMGTCGTVAGMLTALFLLGWKTKVVAVRCVDPIVCNRIRVLQIQKALCRMLGIEFSHIKRHNYATLSIEDSDTRYGVPLETTVPFAKDLSEATGVFLDTTYTQKVVAHIDKGMKYGRWTNADLLYWHTFSPLAVAPREKKLPTYRYQKYERKHVEVPHYPSKRLCVPALEKRPRVDVRDFAQ